MINLVILTTLQVSHAQLTKNHMLIGGSGSWTSTKLSNQIVIEPTVGIFVLDRLAVGMHAGYTHTNLVRDTKVNGFSAAPFVRYYWMLHPKHAVFGEGTVSFSKFASNNEFFESQAWGSSLGVGYNYFLTPSIALEAKTGIQRSSELSRPVWFTKVGFQIYLDRKKK